MIFRYIRIYYEKSRSKRVLIERDRQEIQRKGYVSHRKWYNPEGGAITPVPD
ncbi:MAG: hypothetical protein VKL41_00145 [Snowella sp.]|nr:hypothetical protein [Snowella sp.]